MERSDERRDGASDGASDGGVCLLSYGVVTSKGLVGQSEPPVAIYHWAARHWMIRVLLG